jgi:hypothetical protein
MPDPTKMPEPTKVADKPAPAKAEPREHTAFIKTSKAITLDSRTNEKVLAGESVEVPLKQAREWVRKGIAAWDDPHPDVD